VIFKILNYTIYNMDISSIIIAIISVIGGGSIVSLLTVKEVKKGLKIDNKEKEDNRWERLANELQDQVEKLNDRIEKKDARITELEDINSQLRSQLDDANTNLAKATLLKCDRIECSQRKPPFGYRNVDLDKEM